LSEPKEDCEKLEYSLASLNTNRFFLCHRLRGGRDQDAKASAVYASPDEAKPHACVWATEQAEVSRLLIPTAQWLSVRLRGAGAESNSCRTESDVSPTKAEASLGSAIL
jgi:hypothetical protein